MTKEEIKAKFSRLPEAVQDHLYGEVIGELNGIIIDGNDLTDAQKPTLFALIKELLVGAVPLGSVESEVQGRFGLDAAKSRKLALDVLGYRLLPLDGFLGDVSAAIRVLGGDPASYPTDRVVVPTDQQPPVVTVAMTLDSHLKERYHSIAESFFRGVRSEAQTLELLQKSFKTGGLELSEPVAENALAEIIAEAETHKDEEAKAAAEQPPVAVPKQRLDAPTVEDEAEAAIFKEGVLDSKEAEAANLTDEKIKATIDEIYAASGIFPADLDLQVRLKSAIEGRLRDVRDSLETLETLVQPKELGGVALSQEDARQVLKLVDEKLRAIHEAHQKEVAAVKQAWTEAEAKKQSEAEATTQTKEAVQLDSLYQAIINKSKKALAKSSGQLGAAAATVPATVSVTPSVVDVPIVEKAPLPVVPTPVAPVPPNLPVIPKATLSQPPLVPPSVPVTAAVPSSKPPVVIAPKPSAVARPPVAPVMPRISGAPSARPLMQDIKAPASVRLTGPVAELRDTAIIDFRRLSKDPVEACLKIKDKIDLLLHESYEKRTEGLRAWNDSEVYRAYLGVMREALEGRPLPQVIADRQAAGEPTLTFEEVKAIADLSRKLRY